MADLSALSTEDLMHAYNEDWGKVSTAALLHLHNAGYSDYGPNELQGPNVKDDRPPSGWTGGKASNSNINVMINPKTAEAQLGWKDGVPPMVSLPMGTGANLVKAAASSLMNQGAIRGLGAAPGSPILASTAAETSAEPGVREALAKIAESNPSTDWGKLTDTAYKALMGGGAAHYITGLTGEHIPKGVIPAAALAVGSLANPMVGPQIIDDFAMKAIARKRGGGK